MARLVQEVDEVPLEKQVIIVNDGSTDNTGKILDDLKAKYDFILLTHGQNQGKGAAIQTAVEHVRGDMTVIQDADLETRPENYPRLIQPILDGRADVVLTHRIRSQGNAKPLMYKIYFLGTILQTFFTNVLFRTHIKDSNSGCKVFRSDILRTLGLQSKGFAVEQEIMAKIFRKQYAIRELPIAYFPRMIHEGKKIRLLDGLKGFIALIHYRFTN